MLHIAKALGQEERPEEEETPKCNSARKLGKGKNLVINMSGRGDKDMRHIAKALGQEERPKEEERPKCNSKCLVSDRIHVIVTSRNDEGFRFAKNRFINDEDSLSEIEMTNGPPLLVGTIWQCFRDVIIDHEGVESIEIIDEI